MKKANNKVNQFLRDNKAIVIILLLSFALSIFYSFYFQIKPLVDFQAYDNIAINIVDGYGYWETLVGDIEHDSAITRVGPLYQYFLAGVYYIFGHHYEPVWILQAILHTLTAWLVYLTCLLIFKDRQGRKKIALIVAAIIGFYPDLIEASAMLMIENLYLFLNCLALYVFFRYFNKGNIWSAVLIGLIFGLATLARPPVLFLAPVVLFFFYSKKRIMAGALFIITLLLVFTPWIVRNYIVYDKFMPFGAAGAYNFWVGNYHGANGEQEQSQEARDYYTAYGPIAIQGEAVRQFKNFVVEYPLEFVKLTFLRINKYFSIVRPMGFWFYQSGWSQFLFLLSSGIASVILFIFSLGGIIKSIKLKNEQLNYLMALTIITPLIIFITVVETRYRFQIYPLLAIFAGYFLVYLFSRPKFWLNKALWLAIIIIFVNGFIDLLLSMERFKERLGWFF